MSRSDLHRYVMAAKGRPFRYGRHDCGQFAARWVMHCRGTDLTLGIRYTSLREGRERLAEAGYVSHIEIAAEYLTEIPVGQARAGDIAVVRGALGIVVGERIAALGRRGLAYAPLLEAERAFRV